MSCALRAGSKPLACAARDVCFGAETPSSCGQGQCLVSQYDGGEGPVYWQSCEAEQARQEGRQTPGCVRRAVGRIWSPREKTGAWVLTHPVPQFQLRGKGLVWPTTSTVVPCKSESRALSFGSMSSSVTR